MKTFREHLNEEVSIGALSSGGIDIERDAVRDEINGILSGIAARPCVTPYASLNKIRKALAYFHIHLPKKVYLEGRHGVEVWEVSQFGDKMGVTDSGEWIKNVPAKYYLFFHYHLVGSMYFLQAKIVDDKELETKVSNAERMVAEEMDAAARQNIAKARAPKEDPHTALGDCDCSQGDSPSTKKAVKISMKKIEEGQVTGPRSYKGSPDRKRKAVQMALGRKHKDHPDWNPRTNPQYSALKLGRKLQKQGVTEDNDPCWKGYEMVGMKKKGGRKVPNCVPVKEEEQIDEIKVSTAYSYAGKKMEKERKGLLPGDHNPTSKTELKNMRNAAERTDKDYYKKRGFKKMEEGLDIVDRTSDKTIGSTSSRLSDLASDLQNKKIPVNVPPSIKEAAYSAKAALASKISTMKEALKGRQHEIDANKNKRIDAGDFKLLRARKSMKEADVTSNYSGSKLSDTGHSGTYHGDVSYKSSAERMKSGSDYVDPHRTEIKNDKNLPGL